MKITAVGKSCLIDIFDARGVLWKEEVCDQIRKKWMIYLNEHNPQIFLKCEDAESENKSYTTRVLLGFCS